MLLTHLLLDLLALHTREHKTAREALLRLVAVAVASTACSWPLRVCTWFHARVWLWLWLPHAVALCVVLPRLWPVPLLPVPVACGVPVWPPAALAGAKPSLLASAGSA